MARGGKVVRGGPRLRGCVEGVRGREERRTNDEAGIRAVELQPHFKMIQVSLVENIVNIKIVSRCLNEHCIWDKSDTWLVYRRPKMCASRGRKSGTYTSPRRRHTS